MTPEKTVPSDSLRSLRARLRAGELVVGPLLQIPSPSNAVLFAAAGFDWLWIDMEHGAIGIESAQLMIQATSGTSTVPLVRLAWNHGWMAKAILDAGAMGLVIPMVGSADAAAEAVAAVRYPPVGRRGYGPALAPARWGLTATSYTESANSDILLIVQIEDIEAVENIESILKVPGIDLVFVGMYDLSGSLGLLGEVNHPAVEAAALRVLRAAMEAGIPAGVIALDPDTIRKRIKQGFQLIAVTTDTVLISKTSRELLATIREFPATGLAAMLQTDG